MIKVAYCATAPHGGGALNYLADLVEHHDRTRFDPVVFLDENAVEVESAEERFRGAGSVVRSGPTEGLSPWGRDVTTWEGLLRLSGPFVVANLHQHVPGAGGAFHKAARRMGLPVLVRTEHLPRFPPADHPLRWRRRRTRRALENLHPHVITVSEAGRATLVDRGTPAESVSVVPPAFREERFARLPARAPARATLGLPDDAHVAVFVAGLSIQKRPDLFLDAAQRLLRARDDVHFVVAGDGPLAPTVRERSGPLGERVHVVGHTDEVPALLAASDVFVLPSDFEGLPITVLEALRAGVAVVATAVDGTCEVVRDGDTGLLVPPGDGPALAEAIGRLLDDSDLRSALSKAGSAYVKGRFTAPVLARRTEEVYGTLVAAHR